MDLRIDHVTLAAAQLETARAQFADLGLATDYGGPHSNGVTHMALLGFDDGSYVELISTLEPGLHSPLWAQQIHDNAGPAAWAVRVDDLAAEQHRLGEAGIHCTGPVPMTRARPDGVSLAWDLLFPADGPPGATLPFSISDRTSRELRVQPSGSVRGGDLTGVAQIVVGVQAIDAAAARFRQAYGWSVPTILESSWLGVRLAAFERTPVVLAEPTGHSEWLAERVARYGDSPAAFILAARGGARTTSRPALLPPEPWLGGALAWIDPARLFGWRVGLLLGQ